MLAAKPVPFNPDRVKFDEFGAAMIAAAGPLANLALAFVGALVFHSLNGVGAFAGFLDVFVTLNVALFVFNLIPIPPLERLAGALRFCTGAAPGSDARHRAIRAVHHLRAGIAGRRRQFFGEYRPGDSEHSTVIAV